MTLDGVSITEPLLQNQVLIYNGTQFVNRIINYTDISGTFTAPQRVRDYGVYRIYGQLTNFNDTNTSLNEKFLFKLTTSEWSSHTYTHQEGQSSPFIHDISNGIFEIVNSSKTYKIDVYVSIWYGQCSNPDNYAVWTLKILDTSTPRNLLAQTEIFAKANDENTSISLTYYWTSPSVNGFFPALQYANGTYQTSFALKTCSTYINFMEM